MIATIEANSSSTSALPIAGSRGTGNRNPLASGSFASTLAAAQGAIGDSKNESAGAKETASPATEIAGRVTNLIVNSQIAGNGLSKKSASNIQSSDTHPAESALNSVVSLAVPGLASPTIPLPPPAPSAPFPSIQSTLMAVSAAISGNGSIPQEIRASATPAVGVSVNSEAGGEFTSGLGGNVAGSSVPGVPGGFVSAEGAAQNPDGALPATLSAPQASTSSTFSPGAFASLEEDPTAASPTAPSGSGTVTAAPSAGGVQLETDAMTETEGDTVSGILQPAAAPELPVSSNTGATVSAQDGNAGNEIAQATNPVTAASEPHAGAQIVAGAVQEMSNAAKVVSVLAAPNVRATVVSPVATTSGSSPTPAVDANQSATLASQTPFSIFFSNSSTSSSILSGLSATSSSTSLGPGTESAAAALPKMILPAAAGGAIRNGHGNGNGADAWNPNLQASTSPAGGTQSVGHGAAIVKDALAGTDNETAAAGPMLHNNADATAASVPLTVAGVAGIPAAGNSPTIPLPAVATATVGAESQIRTATLPAAAVPVSSAPGGVVPEPPMAAAPGPVQMAQMVSRAEQSEMRIGMNTSAFGSVEVRTTVHANDVGLVIGSEKGDLRTLLSNELPAMANTLQEKNLTLHSVNFMQGFAFSNNASGGGGSEQQSFVPMRMPSAGEGSEAAAEDAREILPPAEWGSASGNLSILA